MVNREKDFESRVLASRKDYSKYSLENTDLLVSPVELFEAWFNEALDKEIEEANAMSLATANAQGVPHCRMVLMKDFSNEGIVFYSNENSVKGQDLETNPNAAVVFYWKELERQIRAEGVVVKINRKKVAKYFETRPRLAQLGAIASKQSSKLENRKALEKEVDELTKLYDGKPIPLPEHWSGYCLKPNRYEFWQGRANRLHDRYEYTLDKNQNWIHQRLYP